MAPPSQGQEASDEPMLLIDAGMHTSVIGGLGVDRAGQYLVTADVGSVRIWELPGGQLLRTIRLPGALEILALTLSHDGSTVAVAAGRPDTMDSIFLFDRATGRLVRRISDVLVYALAISPDGRFLASNGWDGLRILRIADGTLTISV
jgi:WD40 repeat protein